MKKKIAILLCACAMLSGCGDTVSFDQATEGNNENTVQAETADQDQNAKNRDAQNSENQDAQNAENGDVSAENGDADSEKTDDETDAKKNSEADSEESDETNDVVDRTQFNDYDKAAYFADAVYQAKKDNTLVSPLSLNLALGMAAEGADGETLREIEKYLSTDNYGDWAKKYLEYAKGLTKESVKFSPVEDADEKDDKIRIIAQAEMGDEYTFRYEIADSLWVSKDYRLQDAYKDAVQKNFDAEAQSVDFVNEKEKTADQINQWCKEKTHDLIDQIITPDALKDDMGAVLVNSLYFESPWSKKWTVMPGEFTDLDGKTTEQDMLYDGSLHTYYENDKAIAFSKNYYNGFEFIGILPKETGEFNVRDLDLKSLMDSETTEYVVHAMAPKLNFDCYSEDVADILKDLGVKKAFDKNEGFKRIINDNNLYIDKVLQKCKIELDENGTKAAAVTAMTMKVGSAMREPEEIKEVNLDRPFAFMIYDSVNDQILFVGKVTNLNMEVK